MDKKHGRSFIGYKPSDVKSKIHQETIDFEKENIKYSKELSKLIEENKSLKEELQKLKLQMDSYKELRNKLECNLYTTHMEACRAIYDAHKKYKEMVRNKISIIQTQESKNLEIRSSIIKLLNEIHLIIGNFENSIDEYTNENIEDIEMKNSIDININELRNNYLSGKIAGEDLFDRNNKLIIAKNSVITGETVRMAEREGKLSELIINMTLPSVENNKK